jgi:hypothetical protein
MNEINTAGTGTVTAPAQAPAAAAPVVQAQAPIPGTPEYAAQMAALAPANVPDKFKNQDGSVNLAALTEAYKQLENKQSGKAPAAEPAKAEGEVNLDAEFAKPAAPAPSTAWATAQQELATEGKISDATKAAIKTQHNATDEMITGMELGYRAQRMELGRQVADAVGGQENLKAAIAYAKANLTPEELSSLRASIGTPAGTLALKGLLATMKSATPAVVAPAAPKSILDITPAPVGEAITPFASQAEMIACFNDVRYKTGNPAYQAWVGKRMAMTR